MPFYRPSLTDLQRQALQEIANALPTGTPLRNSVLGTLATTQAGFSHLHFGYLDWIAKQSVPFTATGEFLDAWAALKGVLRTPATYAQGKVTFAGVAGTVIPAGSVVTRADGVTYTTTASVAVGSSGSVDATVSAVEAGSTGNANIGVAVTLANPIAGITSAGTASTDLTGGADVEDDDALRTRMLLKYASPPQGGAATDYINWALAVPGVTRAWCNPNGAGNGSVVLYVMLDNAQALNAGYPQGSNGVATLEKRATAATGDQLTVANAINPLRPATALVYVCAPTPQPINISIANFSPNSLANQDAVKAELAELFVNIGSPLGTTIYPSAITSAIARVTGVDHFTLSSPAAPVNIAVGSLPSVGTVSFS
ncbi:baseplate J/gp47 family protein [Paracraurococcus lichenis]|uniref:Baseplate J/gp47 family protein n=1 Tax=Paracraurococcus lichenis TaxID=3064888 RepID=A0ABT9E4L6_9PROT|nr:baseplate J/gp47 family protein [Paracraurococcus sp. LOR1-02]MDO9711042.1 baseplate J/gp47 family protein [Paracraurococcus sp. LOR1-02]